MQLYSKEMRRDPYPFYRQLSRQSPLISDQQGSTWMVFDYPTVKHILSRPEQFSSDLTPPHSQLLKWLVYSDPPEHTHLRNIFTRSFLAQGFADLEPRILSVAHELLNQHIRYGEMDLVSSFSVPLPARIITEFMGIPQRDQRRYIHHNELMQNLSGTLLSTQMKPYQVQQYQRLQKDFYGYLQRLIQERRKTSQKDLISALIQAENEGAALDTEDMISFMQMMYSGATETTTNLLSNAVITLLEHPQVLQELLNTPELLPGAIEELLRFRSPIQTLIRKTKTTVQLHGRSIPPNRYIFAMIGAANRDPEIFRDPDRFDIHRSPNPHIAFGYGPHYCMGMQLARMEARIAIPLVFQRLKHLRLASTRPWEPQKVQYMLGPAQLQVLFQADAAV